MGDPRLGWKDKNTKFKSSTIAKYFLGDEEAITGSKI